MTRRDGAQEADAASRSVETDLHMEASSRDEVLGGIGRAAHARCPAVDAAAVTRALVEREGDRTTRVDGDVALPHADVDGLEEPTLMDVTLDRPVRWDDGGGEVSRCLVLLVPRGRREDHLRLAAAAARRLRGL